MVFVSPSEKIKHVDDSRASDFLETWIRIDLSSNPTKEIEEDIVDELVTRHLSWTRFASV